MAKAVSEYTRKRNFDVTSEPPEDDSRRKKKSTAHALRYVIQKHDARRLHYDFRLELEGTLKSWAVPKGPSLDPRDKRLAVHVEDHPLSYGNFEGSIPQGHYGAGDVIVWDQGMWRPHTDPEQAYKEGKLKFTLVGEKLSGDWALVKTRLRGSGDKEQWLLIKERDDAARSIEEYDIVLEQPESVLTGALVGGVVKASAAKANKSSPKNQTKENTRKGNTKKDQEESKTKSQQQNTSAEDHINKEKEIPRKKTVKEPVKKETVKKQAKTVKRTTATKFPESLSPSLATLVNEPPAGNWVYEIKFDGYRILTRIYNGEVRFFTRNGHDWTDRLPKQAQAIAALGLTDTWLDGEVVVINEEGLPDFQALQNAFDIGKSQQIFYYVFDAPFLRGEDLRSVALEDRRAALEKIIPQRRNSLLRFSETFKVAHRDIVASACAMSLEGVIGKRAGSVYQSKRTPDWIKLKCRLRQEFVILGFTQPQGGRSGFGALLLGVYEGGDLLYAGKVGTGFDEKSLKNLHERLSEMERETSPLSQSALDKLSLDKTLRGAKRRAIHWVEPTLVGEVEFAEWTGDGHLRQATFIALRTDKPATAIVREKPLGAAALSSLKSASADNASAPEKNSRTNSSHTPGKTSNAAARKTSGKNPDKSKNDSVLAGIKITHPERVIDPQSGAQKMDLARFYADIADWLLPHLQGRPVSLMRAPEGIEGEQFFQKHSERLAIPHIKHLDQALDPGHARLMEIDSLEALIGATQMGTIELHTWGAVSAHIEQPDRIVLDLDPDPVLPWKSMVEATSLTLAVLDELGLDAFLKTSGGKGMHLLIPLARRAGWDEVKQFAKAIAQFMARQLPERFVAKMGPQNRVGKIFIDYLRNQRGASTVAAFSVRARPGLPVSVPITRDELGKTSQSAQWNIGNLHQRLEQLHEDPWAGYAHRQRITKAMWKRLDAVPPK